MALLRTAEKTVRGLQIENLNTVGVTNLSCIPEKISALPTTRSLPEAQGFVLDEQVAHLLRRAHQRASALFLTVLADAQLTPTQFAALIKIGDENEVSQNRLGRLTAMDPATILGVVKRLRARNLVATRPDPHDRRRSLWRLSGDGRRLLEELVPMARRISRDTLAPLARGDRQLFLELLGKLT